MEGGDKDRDDRKGRAGKHERENEVKPRQRERVCARVNEWKNEAQRLNGIEN
jgi:hypothetical protein